MLIRTRLVTRLATVLAGSALAVGSAVAAAPPAGAAARVGVANEQGDAVADGSGGTTFTLRGSGFQSVQGGFGGVYVAFGWVRDPAGGGWRPSTGGVTGRDYRYVPDSESEDNAGYLRFVAFPGSSTADEAQAVMSGSGSFSVSLTVPGPTFSAVDRNGAALEVDCRKVTCGVITFGAHGVKNARNETFTPIRFEEPTSDASGPTSEGPGAGAGADAPEGEAGGLDEGSSVGANPGTTASAGPATRAGAGAPPRRGRPTVTTERSTARAGHALAFTGRGFDPGEQVLALLDDGVVAIGPLVAGNGGEVAAVMALPTDLSPGTHHLRLIGAASGSRPGERFPVRAATVAALATEEPATTDDQDTAAVAFAGASALALLASLALLVSRLRRRTGHVTPAAAPTEVAA
ncbi:hypothetical protein AAII07_09725 [Microvirga sp. 0TCS3.31]